jgi:DnaK suppressor protein
MSGQPLAAKRKLLRARKQVLESLSHLHELLLAEVDPESDEGDEAIAELEKNAVVTALLNRRLQDIDAALHSIQAGHYSLCARCGRSIGFERLEVMPYATSCIQCQPRSNV